MGLSTSTTPTNDWTVITFAHKWTISNYYLVYESALPFLQSDTFSPLKESPKYAFFLRVHPKEEHLALHVHLANAEEDTFDVTSWKLALLNRKENQGKLSQENDCLGSDEFITNHELSNFRNSFMPDLTVYCEIEMSLPGGNECIKGKPETESCSNAQVSVTSLNHRWQINNFLNCPETCLASEDFRHLDGRPIDNWNLFLRLWPCGSEKAPNYLSLYLHVNLVNHLTTAQRVLYQLSVLDLNDIECHIKKNQGNLQVGGQFGFHRFLCRNYLSNNAQRFICENALRILCKVEMISDPLILQNLQNALFVNGTPLNFGSANITNSMFYVNSTVSNRDVTQQSTAQGKCG